MKLSVVIICWNDWKVIRDCLHSIYQSIHKTTFEVIVSDNGSTDESVQQIRKAFPAVRIVENRANLGFAKGNNAGIREARGEYVLILNPDTLVHDGSLDRWIEFADQHPEAGAFGCKVLNADGTCQGSARPFPTVWRDLIAALYLRFLGYLGRTFISDIYVGWNGEGEREIDWQSGCCVMLRRDVIMQLDGFDERFFYHFEEVDLCRRVWNAGHTIRYTSDASITHLGGQSVNRFPIRFALEKNRSRYRYFHKYYGRTGARRCRRVLLVHFRVRQFGYSLLNLLRPKESLSNRLEMYRLVIEWNQSLDPVLFVEHGNEPQLEQITSPRTS